MEKTYAQLSSLRARNAATVPHLPSLYHRHEWFALRDAVATSTHSGFFRGAVACAFNEFPECLDYLLPVIESAPNSRAACHAHDLLTWMYIRQGKFRSALAHVHSMLGVSPRHKQRRALWSLLSALARSPEQSVQRYESSVLPFEMVEGSMFIPTVVNGTHTNLMIDSGATISMMTVSEARRLGLQIREVGPEAAGVYGATGAETSFHITVAAQLEIGECRLSNVTFIVLNDEYFQFPAGYAGALGLPVLIALRTLSWNAKGEFHTAFPAQARDFMKANIAFDGPEPVANAAIRNQQLPLIFDTGNSTTIFGPEFGASFADVFSSAGRKGALSINGVSGSANLSCSYISRVALRVNGFKAVLRSVPVLLDTTTPNSNWFCGRLGMDCLNQAARSILDFHCMQLKLDRHENDNRSA